jgi:hypothetical protein
MRIRSVRDELLHADGGAHGRTDGMTDMKTPTVAFRNFAKPTYKTDQNSLLT